ncbi:sugar transferase, partial [Streptomyces sp. NPDC001919]
SVLFRCAAAQHPEYGVRPVGIVGVPEQGGAPRSPGEAGLPVLTTTEEIHRAVIQNAVRDAVFLDDDPGLVTLFQHYGCTTWRAGGPQDGPMGAHMWGYAWQRVAPPAEGRGLPAKRALDIVLAAPALALALPVLLLCALAVRLADGPGVLFRQERVGQHGRLFTLLKFRTLRPSDDAESATRWNVAGDRRMSAAGSFLRKTSLDELPQLWNVLRGDMSLVGPRPERPFFVAQFSKIHVGYAARHRMPVGLTGLAQVHGLRGDTSIEDRCRFDNHYIDHWSLWQDVCILLRTAAGLVRPTGS